MDGLEREFGNKLKILRINVQENVGRELAPVYNFEYTPTYIFLDGNGQEVWRSIGEIDAQHVRDSVGRQN